MLLETARGAEKTVALLAQGLDRSAFDVPEIIFAEPRKPGGVEVVL